MAETAGPDGAEHLPRREATLAPGPLQPGRQVGWGFIALFAAASRGPSLMLIRHPRRRDGTGHLRPLPGLVPGPAVLQRPVLTIANALPSSVAPALAPAVLAVGGGCHGLLYAVAGACVSSGPAPTSR